MKLINFKDSYDRKRRSMVYVSVPNEGVVEQLTTRRQRPYTAWQPLVEAMLKEHDVNFSRVRWSQKAGCDCGCSPGFIVEGVQHHFYSCELSHEVSPLEFQF